jgi:hypothetical protein
LQKGPLFSETFRRNKILKKKRLQKGPLFSETFRRNKILKKKRLQKGPLFSETFRRNKILKKKKNMKKKRKKSTLRACTPPLGVKTGPKEHFGLIFVQFWVVFGLIFANFLSQIWRQ